MRVKVPFVTGAALGYVLGARAGRGRYEQLRRLARNASESPTVQEAAGAMQAQAAGLLGGARRVVAERVTRVVGGRDVTDEVKPAPAAPYPSPVR